MKMFLLLIGCYISIGATCQKEYLKHPIYLDFNKQYIQVFDKKDSSVITNLSSDSSKLIRIFDFAKEGTLKFYLLDKNFRRKVEGEYLKSLPLKSEIITVKKLNGKVSSKSRVFYKPLRQGDWHYY